MKKLTALFICVMMLVAMAISTSAAGEILWHEDFSDKFTNPNNWILEGNEFFCDDYTDESNPCIAAYDSGRVCQMEYSGVNPRRYTNFSMMSRVQVRDFDSDRAGHEVGYWWRDDFTCDDYTFDGEIGEVYNLIVNLDDMKIEIREEGLENALVSVPVPADAGVEVGGDWFTLGIKVVPGCISGYLNSQKVVEYKSANIAAVRESPVLLLNSACYVAFDDIIIATVDYDLFNEGNAGENQGGDTNATEATEATTSKKVVDVTDDKGNAVTDASGNKVTEEIIVTDAPAADTNAGGTAGGTSTSTGDSAIIVLSVMIVAFGCAIAVKKVNIR